MSPTTLYVVFIPGLTIATVALGFALFAFSMTQPEFQAGTRRGLFSLVLALVVLAVLLWSGVNFDHLNLPPNL